MAETMAAAITVGIGGSLVAAPQQHLIPPNASLTITLALMGVIAVAGTSPQSAQIQFYLARKTFTGWLRPTGLRRRRGARATGSRARWHGRHADPMRTRTQTRQ